jgi:CBS domain containing-hemolysin-like protein
MLLLLAVFLILLNGFFVAAEFALVKIRASQLDTLVQKGNSNARLARSIIRNLDPYLSATQLGITLASLGLGWLGEPAVAELLRPLCIWVGIHDEYLIHTLSVTVAFILISFLHIVVGEVAPKSLALARPESVSLFVALPMQAIYLIFYPALLILNRTSSVILRFFGVEPAIGVHGMAVSREELMHITSDSADTGALNENESKLLSNVLSFSDRVAREIMVPRNKVDYLREDNTIEDALKLAVTTGHSRFPLVRDDLDNVLGLLHMKDLIQNIVEQRPVESLVGLLRKVVYVPENMPAQKLLLEFQKERQHFACVVDEYGGISGIVTIEDALEELVGEIQDEFDKESPLIVEKEDGSGLVVDGAVLLDDLWKRLHIPEREVDADTVSGFLMEELKRMPQNGDSIELPGWRATILAMDGRRVGKVELIKDPAAGQDE